MDTYRENFGEVLPEIEEAIAGCEFLALDLEMTGINLTDPAYRHNYGDTPEERYKKMRPVASRYNIIQLGLCTFSKGKEEELVARPYNVYTCADEGEDVCLSLSAITFLRNNEMNFDDWLTRGVTYLNAAGEESLKKRLDQERERDKERADAGPLDPGQRMKLNRQSDKDFVESQMQLLANWYAQGGSDEEDEEEDGKGTNGGAALSPEEKAAAARRKKELPLTKCNAFLRRALFEAVEARYPELVAEARGPQLVVLRLTEAEKREREEQRERDRQARLHAAVGARHVFKAIGACGKPLVVHNGMYDLMFFMNAFHGPLPERLDEFKAQLKACLPNPIYDTKFYASALEEVLGQEAALADSTVEGLYTNLVKAEPDGPGPRVRLAPGFEKYEGAGSGEASKEFAHEAGYDAYLTGAIFARLRAMGPAIVAQEAEGRIFTYRSLFGLNLLGEDPRMHAKDHVFHLGIAPEAKAVKTDDLMKLFGENSIHCIIYWVNDQGAFCVVKDAAGPLETVIKGMSTCPGVTATEFSEWYAAKRAMEGEGGAAGGEGEVGLLAGWLKRGLNLIGWSSQGREKRMRVE